MRTATVYGIIDIDCEILQSSILCRQRSSEITVMIAVPHGRRDLYEGVSYFDM